MQDSIPQQKTSKMNFNCLKSALFGIAFISLCSTSQAAILGIESTVEAGSMSHPTRASGTLSGIGQLERQDSMFTGEPSQITESQLQFPYFYMAHATVSAESSAKFHLNLAASASDSPPEGGASTRAQMIIHDELYFQPDFFSLVTPVEQFERSLSKVRFEVLVVGKTAGTGFLSVGEHEYQNDRSHFSPNFFLYENAQIAFDKSNLRFIINRSFWVLCG